MATLVKFTCKSFIQLTPGCCPVYMTRFYQPVVVVFRIVPVIIVYRVSLRLEYRLIGSAWKYQRALHVHISQRTGVILHKKKTKLFTSLNAFAKWCKNAGCTIPTSHQNMSMNAIHKGFKVSFCPLLVTENSFWINLKSWEATNSLFYDLTTLITCSAFSPTADPSSGEAVEKKKSSSS